MVPRVWSRARTPPTTDTEQLQGAVADRWCREEKVGEGIPSSGQWYRVLRDPSTGLSVQNRVLPKEIVIIVMLKQITCSC